MIFNYIEFINEVNNSKFSYFKKKEISNLFTTSIEIEMETNDDSNRIEEYDDDDINYIINNIKNSTIKELNRINEFKINDDIINFIDNILIEIKEVYFDIDDVEETLNEEYFEEKEKIVIQIIKPQVLSYFFSDNFKYLQNKFIENLPNFFKKWGDYIKFELDNTLDRGIEISLSKYFDDIDTLIYFINDFFIDFNSQNYWIFNQKTGIHFNIGLKNKSKINIIKGILFLDDMGDSPFVYKNMEWRKKSEFTKSIKEDLSKSKDILKKSLKSLEKNNINNCESILNKEMIRILNDNGYKKYGINLLNIEKSNYIEFRYVGGKISEEVLLNKILYFCYIFYLMIETTLDKKSYIKKLYSFLFKNKD